MQKANSLSENRVLEKSNFTFIWEKPLSLLDKINQFLAYVPHFVHNKSISREHDRTKLLRHAIYFPLQDGAGVPNSLTGIFHTAPCLR